MTPQCSSLQPTHSFLSPPAGSCPTNRPSSSRRCRKSPRSTSVCPWRTRSCCGSCTTATCWRVPAASHPPRPTARHGTLPPSPQVHPYRPDNPNKQQPPHPSSPLLSSDLLILLITFFKPDKDGSCSKSRERLQSQLCCWILMMNLYIWNKWQ